MTTETDTETERAFEQALQRNPDDAPSRAVYADWLEERGRTHEAMIVRSKPNAKALVRIIHQDISSALRAVSSRWMDIRKNLAFSDDEGWAKGNSRWANGASINVADLPLDRFATPNVMLREIETFLQNRPWDQDYDEPTHARDEMMAAISRVRAARLPIETFKHEYEANAYLQTFTEIVFHTFTMSHTGSVIPPDPIEGVVTISNGLVHYNGSGRSFAISIDGYDARAICDASTSIAQRSYEYVGEPDTRKVRTVTQLRMTHKNPFEGSFAGSLLEVCHESPEAKIGAPWRPLIEMVSTILRLKLTPLPDSLTLLLERILTDTTLAT